MTANWKEILTSHVEHSSRPLVVILGPTASGKTAFSLEVAEFFAEQRKSVEIVNADSRQLYRLLDIGTAKIRPDAMRGIPHHMIDVLDPKEEATAAWYKEKASTVIDAILERKHIPFLVGGSMLYISALIDALQFVEAVDPAIRKTLEEAYDADEGVSLYRKLTEIDPETTSAFHRNNRPYVIRAMEIFESSSMKPSVRKGKGSCPWDLLILGVTLPRAELVRRIDTRTEQMLKNGWIEEVRALLERGYSAEDPGLKSVGYREIAEAILSGKWKEESGKLAEVISAKTRQYAKRQMTWWKRDPRIYWIDLSDNVSF